MNTDKSEELWRKICKRYNKNGRHYHNFEHIGVMVLSYYYSYENKLTNPDEILFAIFYHDVIYNPLKKDNEMSSAIYMCEDLEETKLSEESIAFIFDAILSTEKHERHDNQDINYLLDFDMSILGKPKLVYQTYTQSIRKEYWMYPKFMYNKGRKSSLQSFLKQDRIFKTDDFYKLYEEQSRKNINREIEKL